jgi:hypothetical protein
MSLYPLGSIFPEAPSIFDWNYATYFGDGIPLLFWVWINPFPACTYSNDFKWQIYTDGNSTVSSKTVPFQYGRQDNGQKSLLKFPSTYSYQSDILYSAYNGSTLGPYRQNYAVILVDSPWARSCANRVQTSETEKNKNYAVGVSIDMLNRIAQTYNTWDKWFNTQNYPGLGGLSTCTPGGTNTPRSLLPSYLKNAIINASYNTTNGGVLLMDVLGFKPTLNGYGPNIDQAGIILPEIGGLKTNILATQCHIDATYNPVNPFAKTFFGAFVAIYKDYDVQDTIVNKSLLINVPWSGSLTGAGRDIDYPNYRAIPDDNIYKLNVPKAAGQCSLTCPQDITIDAQYAVYYVNSSDTSQCYLGNSNTNYFPYGYPLWTYDSTAPFTWPRFGRVSNASINMNDYFGTFDNPNLFTNGPVNPCEVLSYDISGPSVYNLSVAPPANNPIDIIGPWWHRWTITDLTRQLVAGGGCGNSVFNLF